ncbi:MAG: hypothetical protein WBJ87_08245 [Candidatus Hydrothermia bacterium]
MAKKDYFTPNEITSIVKDFKTKPISKIYRASRDDWEPRGLYEYDVRGVIDDFKKHAIELRDAAIENFDTKGENKYNELLEKNFPDKRLSKKPVILKSIDILLKEQITQELIAEIQAADPVKNE